ncbi:hypothetical protein [Sediminibacillus albus]|uniref:Uncharacterized protein n=1 Tax=Sediminibacillus albus TaxID=407036 RepID=A0A1G9B466_9BACI|nr:hypothetical protein [Sediminibacillus albus]SDK34356.1 hypothetical protein SAMN05216243_2804 [Sediminibacillus albus]
MYKVVGIVKAGIEVEFFQQNKELVFPTYEEAVDFIEETKRKKMLPENYQLVIEKIKT